MNDSTPHQRPKAYSYLRFSTPEQDKGDSKRRQEALAVAYAALHGLDLDTQNFFDKGVSAFRSDNARTGALREFRNAVESGVIAPGSYLLVESLDRITRADIVTAQSLFMAIIAAGVTVVTLQPGSERAYSMESLTKTPMDLLLAILEMMRAHEESSTKAKRLKAAWANKRKNLRDKNMTSVVPAWIKARADHVGFDLIPERAEIVQRVFREYLAGAGMESIAIGLNRDGVPQFGRGTAWMRSYISKILKNPAAIGTYVPHMNESSAQGRMIRVPLDPVQDYYPAAVTTVDFEKAQAMQHQGSSPPRPREGGVKSALAGLGKCPLCGSTMTRINKGPRGGQPYLVCTKAKIGAGCKYHMVRLNNIHAALHLDAALLVGTAPVGEDNLDTRLATLEDHLAGIMSASDRLLDAIVKGKPSGLIQERLIALEQERETTVKERDDVRRRLMETASPFVAKALEELEAALTASEGDPLDIPAANAALRRLVSGVIVDWRSGDLVFRWKQGGESRITYAMPI